MDKKQFKYGTMTLHNAHAIAERLVQAREQE